MFDFLSVMPEIYSLALLFFGVALLYSSVGLGGGSTYTAILALLGFNLLLIPSISLSLNLLVTTVGSLNFIRNHHARVRLITPFLVTSMPAAYVGGSLNLAPHYFQWILMVSLVFVVSRIYLWDKLVFQFYLTQKQKIMISLLSGVLLGLIAGIVGIGGGIYLVPLIIILGLGSKKEAAACGAIFIWLNSAVGLWSRYQYNDIQLWSYWPLMVAVLLGGILGSYLGSFHFNSKQVDRYLGLVILLAIGSLSKKLLFSA